jgi:hypothetical protein
MVNVSSLFGQIVSELFTAVNFDNLVAKWGAERHAKGFRSKTQLISMLFLSRSRNPSSSRALTNLETVGKGYCNSCVISVRVISVFVNEKHERIDKHFFIAEVPSVFLFIHFTS